MKQDEDDQNHKKESTPFVGIKPYGKCQLNTTVRKMKCCYNRCESCDRVSRLLYTVIQSFAGFLIYLRIRTVRGYLCESCTSALLHSSTRETCTVGLLCPVAIYYVPAVLLNRVWLSICWRVLRKKNVLELATNYHPPPNNTLRIVLLIAFIIFASVGGSYLYIYHLSRK